MPAKVLLTSIIHGNNIRGWVAKRCGTVWASEIFNIGCRISLSSIGHDRIGGRQMSKGRRQYVATCPQMTRDHSSLVCVCVRDWNSMVSDSKELLQVSCFLECREKLPPQRVHRRRECPELDLSHHHTGRATRSNAPHPRGTQSTPTGECHIARTDKRSGGASSEKTGLQQMEGVFSVAKWVAQPLDIMFFHLIPLDHWTRQVASGAPVFLELQSFDLERLHPTLVVDKLSRQDRVPRPGSL